MDQSSSEVDERVSKAISVNKSTAAVGFDSLLYERLRQRLLYETHSRSLLRLRSAQVF
ncbi:MAG: hypothetical protein RMX97_32720 [Nostoc sp. DedQUE11]|nr:hypothetical protein [Nostoc sp. DedQUE11]